jgi:hypothetical protein
MRNFKIILVLSLGLSMFSVAAQVSPMSVKGPGVANRDAGYYCLPNSLFSQLPSPFESGWYGDDGFVYTRIADDYTVTGPFAAMRLWGANAHNCPPGETVNFVVKFYERNAGDPSIPGTEVNSFSMTIVPEPISLYFGVDYQIDLNFPTPVTLLDGWVSVTRVNPGDGCRFVWLGGYGGNSASYSDGWYPSGGNLSFCLGGAPIPETPVSDWALVIGFVLIATFILVRYKRA